MTVNDLKQMYDVKKKKYGKKAYKYISELLAEAKEQHKIDFFNSPKALKKIAEGGKPDHGQSWRAFKGNSLEKLIQYVIESEIQGLGLNIINGKTLNPKRLTKELKQIKENLLLDFGIYGEYLPDVDMVIYVPKTLKVLAILSSKVTLRERVAQTGYWFQKLKNLAKTKHIKIWFITLDEDGDLNINTNYKKSQAIVATDTDGCYVMTKETIEETDKIKLFKHFMNDLKKLSRS